MLPKTLSVVTDLVMMTMMTMTTTMMTMCVVCVCACACGVAQELRIEMYPDFMCKKGGNPSYPSKKARRGCGVMTVEVYQRFSEKGLQVLYQLLAVVVRGSRNVGTWLFKRLACKKIS